MDKKADNSNTKIVRTIILSLVTTVLFVCIISVYYRMLYNENRENIVKNGKVNAIESADQIDKRMSSSMDILKLASYALDNMIKGGRSQEEILNYLTMETDAVSDSLIADTTGIYGYIRGTYMDGSGWVPEEGYDPVSRPWYTAAMAGDGNIVLVDPYIDLETGKTMTTIARTLCDGESVVAIDVSMSELQAITEEHVARERSYAEFIINAKGRVIAHSNKLLIGRNINEHVDAFTDAVSDKIISSTESNFYTEHDGKDYMVYKMPLENEWMCVSIIDASSDFNRLERSLVITIVMAVIIALMLSFFVIRSERTGRLAREAMIRTERATAASEAKTSFISSMSHEIRTPINAILGMNEMIQREEKDETILSYSDTIKNAGTTLLGIINDILDFSKIEAGKIEIIPVDYDLVALVNDLVNLIGGRAKDKGLALEVNIDSRMPHMLYGDEIRIKQVITNILTNAVKYTEEGSVTFDVGFDPVLTDENSMMLNVSVTDTGIGIKEEDIQKLFSKYERIEEERNRSVEGTGLGMSITKNLLELMDSELEVSSTYGVGSTFSFSLKQKVRDWDPVGNREAAVKESIERLERYKEKFTADMARVLVVDDNRMNLTVFENLIKQTRVSVDKAKDGYEAVNMSRNVKYDILFIDHLMPGKDGIETLHDIRSDDAGPNTFTPAICLTANAVSGAKEEYVKAGFNDYLTKPIDGLRLEEMLLAYLPAHKISGPAAKRDDTSPVKDIYKKMKDAAENLDCGHLEDALEELKAAAPDDKALFEALKRAVDDYDYDEVAVLLTDKA